MSIELPNLDFFMENDVFTVADIRNIAIQIENNGAQTYHNASKLTKIPEIAKTLLHMADDERRHAEWFQSIQSQKSLSGEQLELEAMGRVLLQDMIKGNKFLLQESSFDHAESVREVLIKAQSFEQDTILFYQFLLGFLDDQESIGSLEKIITEEYNHLRYLESLEDPAKMITGEPLSC